MCDLLTEIAQKPLDRKSSLVKQIIDRTTRFYEDLRPENRVRIASVRAMAGALGTTVRTVFKAYKVLEERRIIVLKGSRGSFFVPVKAAPLLHLNPFAQALREPDVYSYAEDLPPADQVLTLDMGYRSLNSRVSAELMNLMRSGRNKPDRNMYCSDYRKVLLDKVVERLHDKGFYIAPENALLLPQAAGLEAVADALLRPGSGVVMDSPMDRLPLSVFKRAGCRVRFTGLKLHEGMDMDVLRELCLREPPRLVFIRADSSWPEGRITPARQRRELIGMAIEFDFLVVEYEREALYTPHELPQRLASHAHGGRVILVSCISRSFLFFELMEYVVADVAIIAALKKNLSVRGKRFLPDLVGSVATMIAGRSIESLDKKSLSDYKKCVGLIFKFHRHDLSPFASILQPECGRFLYIVFNQKRTISTLVPQLLTLPVNFCMLNMHFNLSHPVSGLRLEFCRYDGELWQKLMRCIRTNLRNLVTINLN